VVIVGSAKSGKTALLEQYARECRERDIPCLLLHGRMPAVDDVLKRLAAIAEYDRTRIENSVLLLDDVDALSDDASTQGGSLYIMLYPFMSGVKHEYGKYSDMADLARVDVVATATERRSGQGIHGNSNSQVELPGIFAEMLHPIHISEAVIPVEKQSCERVREV
jgi:GTPase SAR1 family protein